MTAVTSSRIGLKSRPAICVICFATGKFRSQKRRSTSEARAADWLSSVVRSYSGESMDHLNLLVKGDNAAKYPTFKFVKDAFKRNDIFKFKIVTNPEGVPADSELALNPPIK